MKRCPTEAGGCGELHEFLFDSGLCQSCDAAVKAGTAAVGGTPKRRAGRPRKEQASNMIALPKRRGRKPKCREFVLGDEPGICAKCKISENSHYGISGDPRLPKRNSKKSNALDDPLLVIERLRSQWTDEHAALTEKQLALIAKLEVLDDVEKELKAGK